MALELGNAHPQDVHVEPGGTREIRVDLPGPVVTYVIVADGNSGRPVGLDREGGETEEAFLARDAAHQVATAGPVLASFPVEHNDNLLNNEMAAALAAVPGEAAKVNARRLLLSGHMSARQDGVTHLPNHSAFVAICHPVYGAWQRVAAPGTKPTWVHYPENPALQAFLAEFWDCPIGRPANVEDTHYTQHGTNVYGPGSVPPPDAGVTMMHTTWGRDSQALVQFAFTTSGFPGAVGTATATTATTLTGGSETGVFAHTTNDVVGSRVVCTSPSGDAGKWMFVNASTAGTSPVYSGDRWYSPGSPGGAAAATPSATATYVIEPGGAPSQYVALTTDSTAPVLGGSAGTADAPAATTTLTSEITTTGGGLVRRIWTTMTHSAGAATVVQNTTFTTNGSDSLPVTIEKAAMCCSVVAGGSALAYLTLLPTAANLTLVGDQITTQWSITES